MSDTSGSYESTERIRPSTSRARGGTGRGRRRGRGRIGRGASQRGGRGASQRGGRAGVQPVSDIERVKQRREERKRQNQDLIRRVPDQQLRDLVLQLTEREPGLIFDLCENASGAVDTDPQPHSREAPTWCRCSFCVEMPTDIESKCCDCLPRNCVSQRMELETLVLDPQVLAIGNRFHRDMLGMHGQNVEDYNKSMRHAAYRNFTLWRHGRLGQGQRRVIPSCVVKRIRVAFPSNTNTYTGFIPGRFA